MKKQFKIGEYAYGGIISVEVNGDKIIIDALDYQTKMPMPFSKDVFSVKDINDVDDYLNDLTTSYFADKILTEIKDHLKK